MVLCEAAGVRGVLEVEGASLPSSSSISRSLSCLGVDCERRNRGELENRGPAPLRVECWRRDKRNGDGV